MFTHSAEDFDNAVMQSDLISTLSESMDACVKILDREGRVKAVNARGLELIGIENADDFCGHIWYHFWDEITATLLRQKMALALSGTSTVFVAEAAAPGAMPVRWHVTLHPLQSTHGRCENVLAIAKVVTDVLVENSLLKDEVDFLQNQLRQRHTALAALHSYMHDVNNMMASVLASSRLIRRRGTDTKSATILADLEDQVGKMSSKWAGFPNRLPEFMRKTPSVDHDRLGDGQ